MKRWQWALLVFELALFALILILPQVELPAFAFHGGTAPVAVKARSSFHPPQPSAFIHLPRIISGRVLEPLLAETPAIIRLAGWDSRLSLLCTLLC